jgi:hypothetical protein
MHAAIRASYLWIIPNGGHGPIFGEMAAAFAGVAIDFLSGKWERK